jgi:hypothetical protein
MTITWKNIPLGGGGGTPTRVGASVTELNAPGVPEDGALGEIRLGAWPNRHSLPLIYDASISKWASEEITVIRQLDPMTMDLGNRSGSELLTWTKIDNEAPYARSFTQTTAQIDLSSAAFAGGTGTIPVHDTASDHSSNPFQPGTVWIRDNAISVGSVTPGVPGSLNNCTLVQGSGGIIPATVDVVQDYTGGYGLEPLVVKWAAEMYAAGFQIYEFLSSLMNPAPDGKRLSIAPYWRQFNDGDGATAPRGTYLATGGLGLGNQIISGTNPGGDKASERSFFYTTAAVASTATVGGSVGAAGWQPSPIVPTKRYIIPQLYGKMEAGAIDTGEVLDTKLSVKWVG